MLSTAVFSTINCATLNQCYCTLHFLPKGALLHLPEHWLFSSPPSIYLRWRVFLKGYQCGGRVLCDAMVFVCLTNVTCNCHIHPTNKNKNNLRKTYFTANISSCCLPVTWNLSIMTCWQKEKAKHFDHVSIVYNVDYYGNAPKKLLVL